MTTRRAWREVDGIVLLDKPPGLSSNTALQRVRRLLQAAKAGHAGTLDPMATGMLPLCFGQATKACGSLLGGGKAYEFRLQLGVATDTADAEGRVTVRMPVPPIEAAHLRSLLGGMEGSQSQVPPMHSALKHGGERLYELARRGEEVPRAPRHIELRRLDLVELGPDWIDVRVECSKGTYVRVLGEDIARALGTVGHLTRLRRLWVEPFAGEPMIGLEAIEAWAEAAGPDGSAPPFLLRVERAFREWPAVRVDSRDALALEQGRIVAGAAWPGAATATTACAYDEDGALVGLVSIEPDGSMRTLRLLRRPTLGGSASKRLE